MSTPSKRHIATYRARVKSSRCRVMRRSTCRRRPGCKKARGTKRVFCRKSRNRPV